MQTLKGHLYRVYPTASQWPFLHHVAGCVRLVRNLGREQREAFARRGRPFRYEGQRAELTALKEAAPFLRDVPHHCLQEALVDLQRAYDNFFAGLAAYPKPRRKRDRQSFRFPDPKQFRVEPSGDGKWALLRLPKLGKWRGDHGALKVRLHRPLEGKPRSVTVSLHGGECHVSILCAMETAAPAPNAGPVVGVDLGVAVPIMRSDGVAPHVPLPTARQEERKRRLHRALARRRRGSRNRAKAKLALARHEAKAARRRRDALHKATTGLVRDHRTVFIEDLRVRQMTKSAKGTKEAPGRNVAAKSGLNRAILAVGWGMFRSMLEYKAPWHDSEVRAKNPAGSSQTCSACWRRNPASRVSRDVFRCVACGHVQHADLNAARVIRGPFQAEAPEDTRSGPACGALCESTATKQELRAARHGSPVFQGGE